MKAETNSGMLLDCRTRMLDCHPGASGAPYIMGILNVTPDSFSDGGQYARLDDALRRVETMLNEGATIIDIGGESTRPKGKTYGAGAATVNAEEEIARVLPVVRGIRDHFPEAILSIDTYKPAVAKAALEAGVHMVNDVTGLRIFPEMADIVAAFNVPLVLMHALGRPGEMPHTHRYRDVVAEVKSSLSDSIDIALNRKVKQLVLDPGFGFGKTPTENLRLLNELHGLSDLKYPILVGISRKSTIGITLGSEKAPYPVEDRLFGTLGATAVAVLRGAAIVRTHDVNPTVEMTRVLSAVMNA